MRHVPQKIHWKKPDTCYLSTEGAKEGIIVRRAGAPDYPTALHAQPQRQLPIQLLACPAVIDDSH
jgi:hypothetical protein